MKTISYSKLYNYFQEEKYSLIDTLRCIWIVRHLPNELKELMNSIVDGTIPDYTIDNISMQQLMQEEEMNGYEAVMFFDYYREDPDEALNYMAAGRWKSPMQPLSEEDMQIVSSVKKILEKKFASTDDSYIVPADESKEDILLDK